MVTRRRFGSHWVLWVAIVLAATGSRLIGPDWDGGIAAHPDERYVIGVAQDVRLLENVCAEVPDFPYGHLPVTVARLFVLAAPEADPLYTLRLFSGLVGVSIVALAGACGKELVGWRGGLLAAFLAAFAPFLIQQGHFYTVDPIAAALGCAGVLAARRRRWGVAGALTGLAVASKLSLATGAVVLLVVAFASGGQRSSQGEGGGHRWFAAGRFALGGLSTFAVASPWSLLTPRLCWRGPLMQSLMASGRFEFPYTQQYAGTLPYIYPIIQIALWGLGPFTTLVGLWGLLSAAFRALRWRSVQLPAALEWLWPLVYFLAVGGLRVKFARYMLPLYPWWIAWAARVVGPLRYKKLKCAILASSIAVPSFLLGLAQLSIYGTSHPWIAASDWLYATLAPKDTVAVEAWDHPLPVPLGFGDPDAFVMEVLPVYEEEDRGKMELLSAAGERAEAVVLASRRGYGTVTRRSELYPSTISWYAMLFDSREEYVFARCPRLGPLAVTDDPLRDAGLSPTLSLAERCGTAQALRLPRLDENFRVYDAPMTIVLIK
ncbi:MAG: hypothetical protein ACP5HS_05645 [Anaerolineae bacterium]